MGPAATFGGDVNADVRVLLIAEDASAVTDSPCDYGQIPSPRTSLSPLVLLVIPELAQIKSLTTSP